MQGFPSLSLIIGVELVAFALILWFVRQAAGHKHGNYPISLPSLPLVGSLLHLHLGLHSHSQPHVMFCKLQKKYGSIFSLKMGSAYVVVVNSHKHARDVLMKRGKVFADRPRTNLTVTFTLISLVYYTLGLILKAVSPVTCTSRVAPIRVSGSWTQNVTYCCVQYGASLLLVPILETAISCLPN